MNFISKSIKATLIAATIIAPIASYASFTGVTGPLGSFGVETRHRSHANCKWVNGSYAHYNGHRHWHRGYKVCR